MTPTSLRNAAVAALSVLTMSACIDNGHLDTSDCTPLVKFSNPDGVSPQAIDGVVSLPVDVTTCDSSELVLWAWTSDGDMDVALDVFEAETGGNYVAVPVLAERDDCQSASVTVALVDDGGHIVDQDRTFLSYELAR